MPRFPSMCFVASVVFAALSFAAASSTDPVRRPLLFFAGTPATVEHAVHASDVVVDGEVVEVLELEFACQFRVTIDVTERIKGDAPERLAFELETPQGMRREVERLRRGPFFLMKPAAGAMAFGARDPLDVLTETGRTWFSAVGDFRAPRSREELLDAARAAAAAGAAPLVSLLLPENEYGESSVLAPATDAVASRAATWAAHDDWRMRANAARVLALRSRAEAEAILLGLLRDGHYDQHGIGKAYRRHYEVRDEARRTLGSFGVRRAVVVFEPDDLYAEFRWIHATIVVAGVGMLWYVAVLARRQVLRVRRCWPARVLFDAWLVLLVLLVVALVRSPHRADQIVFNAGGAGWELASQRRMLHLVRLPEGSNGARARFAAFPVGSDLDQTWDSGRYIQGLRTRQWGVGFARGWVETGGNVGAYVEWSGVEVPLWLLLVASLLLPASSWVIAVIGWYREARRRRCVHCGYDLRASIDRCPECGTEVFGLKTRRQVAALEAAQGQYERELAAYREHEARMLELLAAGAVDEEGKPVTRAEDDTRPRVDVEDLAH